MADFSKCIDIRDEQFMGRQKSVPTHHSLWILHVVFPHSNFRLFTK